METTTVGKKVDVYFNLHKKMWSVRDRKTRRVIAHLDGLVLSDVTFRVSAAGNARVRAEGRKNVHAFASGTVVDDTAHHPPSGMAGVTYNPYRHTTFVTKYGEHPVHDAGMAYFDGRTVMVSSLPIDMVS